MELEESVQEGALRELKEEADARTVGPVELLAVYSIPRHGQVHMFMRAALDECHVAKNAPAVDPTVRTCYGRGDGVETQEARLFAPAEIPWAELAFPITAAALKHHAAHPLGSRTAVDVQSFTPYSSPKK
jgi:ADP-ribose pyrophosphatase YjhB (NUDIX family)